MNRTLSIIAILAGIMVCLPAAAQQHPNRHGANKLKYVIGTEVNITDSVNAYKLLYENIPQDNDFLNDPIFAIVGRHRYFYFSVGADPYTIDGHGPIASGGHNNGLAVQACVSF